MRKTKQYKPDERECEIARRLHKADPQGIVERRPEREYDMAASEHQRTGAIEGVGQLNAAR